MDKRYAKQIIEFNEQSKKHIELDSDWILGIKDNEALGRLVREKILNKIKELDNYIEQIKKETKL